MSNTATLKPLERGSERTKAIARKGGLASGRARREAAAHGMTIAQWGRAKTLADAAKKIGGNRAFGKAGRKGMTNAEAVIAKMYQSALRGSVRAANLLALLLGEVTYRHAGKLDFEKLPVVIDDVPRCDLAGKHERQAGMIDRGNK